jgi:hypothetical protein
MLDSASAAAPSFGKCMQTGTLAPGASVGCVWLLYNDQHKLGACTAAETVFEDTWATCVRAPA